MDILFIGYKFLKNVLVFGKEFKLEKFEHNITTKTFLQYFGKFTNSLKNLVIFFEK